MKVVRPGKKIQVKVVLDGVEYTLDHFPYTAKIPDNYFNKMDGVTELNQWLLENAEGKYYVSYHTRTVLFFNESDAIYMKLVLG